MNMNDENLIWLLTWYESQCDGDWEHGNGVHINPWITLDGL